MLENDKEREKARIIEHNTNTNNDLTTCIRLLNFPNTEIKGLGEFKGPNERKNIPLYDNSQTLGGILYLLYHNYPPIEIKRNQRDCMNIIKECIKEALRKLLPVKHILNIYLGEDMEVDMNDNQFEKSITEAEERNLTKIIKKDLTDTKELEYKIFESNIPKENSASDSKTIGSKILNIIKPDNSATPVRKVEPIKEVPKPIQQPQQVNLTQPQLNDRTSSDSSLMSDVNKEIPDGTSITGSLDNDTSELNSDFDKSLKKVKPELNENLDNKIKKILNNDLIETEFDTSLTDIKGGNKYQEVFSNSDNKGVKKHNPEELFKKFMDF